MAAVSLRLWNPKGKRSCHSMVVGWWKDEITLRWARNLSHKMKIKRSRATKEIIDPKEDTVFQ